eukprot:3523948-Ditylum_brightwellii.AAC.1
MDEIKSKRVDAVSNVVETTWIMRYLYPTQVVCDRGTEFITEFAEMIVSDYGVKKKPITARNIQANSIIKRIY